MKLTRSNAIELQYIRALVYGDSGVGKTTSAQTLPEDRTLLAICERGALPLRNYDFPVVTLDTWTDVEDLYKGFNNPQGIEDKDIQAVVKKTTVLFLDSLSEVSEMCIKHILLEDRPRLIKARGDKAKKAAERTYAELMELEDWNLYKTKMLGLCSAFCHLPVNIIMTCRSAWLKDKGSQDTLRLPGLTGKSAVEVPGYFDQVFYMLSRDGEGGKNERVWQTFADREVRAKDSAGVLDPFEETNWTKVFKKILGNGKKGNSKP